MLHNLKSNRSDNRQNFPLFPPSGADSGLSENPGLVNSGYKEPQKAAATSFRNSFIGQFGGSITAQNVLGRSETNLLINNLQLSDTNSHKEVLPLLAFEGNPGAQSGPFSSRSDLSGGGRMGTMDRMVNRQKRMSSFMAIPLSSTDSNPRDRRPCKKKSRRRNHKIGNGADEYLITPESVSQKKVHFLNFFLFLRRVKFLLKNSIF